MKLWRISRFVDLEGKGGHFASGRWHHKGRPIVYAAEHPALAMVEYLVNVVDRASIQPDTVLFSIEVPSDVTIAEVEALPSDWRSMHGITRDIGSAWLDGGATLVLKVPSAPSPSANNYLINPSHPDLGRLTIVDQISPPFDERLFDKLR